MNNISSNEMQSTRSKGTESETLASEFILNKGYEIIKRNFKFGRSSEIDIIAKDGNTIVFFEVKSRKSFEYGSPVESVPPAKRKAIYHAAKGYLYINKIENADCRFDFIGIDLRRDTPEITHIENAF